MAIMLCGCRPYFHTKGGPSSSNQSISSGSSTSSNENRKWSLPSKITDFLAKRRNKDAKPSKEYHLIKEDSVEFILDSDEAQNTKTKPEPSPGISDLQQQSLLQSQSQQTQRLQHQPQSREENPQNSLQDQPLNKQQLIDQDQSKPQEPRQQNQAETQLHQPQHLKKQELARQKLKQPLQRQQQYPEPFRRTSGWDEIRTPEGRVIPTFQGERRPLQSKAKEPRLLPHPGFNISPSLPEYHTLSERQLATSNPVLFETISTRQPSAPQLEQRTARRHSIIETPRGPQRASQIQYQNMERRMSQNSQNYQPQRDHNLSLPNTPQRGVTVRENKTTQNTPLRIPQNDQRRPSQEYRLNQGQNLEPPQREIWQQPSTSQFSGPLQVQPRNFASSSQCIPGLSQNQSQNYSSPHGVVSQAPIQNYLAASQCVVGASQYYGNSSQTVTGPPHGISHYHHASSTQAISGPTPGPSQYHGSSTQTISGPTPGPSQYYKSSTQSISGPTPGPSQYYKSSTQSISGPTPGPSQYHKSSTQSISGPTPGISQYRANSAQSVVGEAKYRGTLIQSGSGYDQSHLQYNRNPQSVPAPTHGQKYRASTSQSVAGLNRGQSNYQGHSSLTISVPTQGQVKCPSNTGQAITVSGTTQSQSYYHASAKKCAQSSNVSTQVSSQCQASSMKGNLKSSDVSVPHIVGPSHGVTETSQNQVQNVTLDRNTPGPSQNNDNSSQRDTNSTQSITQNTSSSSKGAIPKNYRGQKNDVSNKGITQPTASLSINVAGSSEKIKETSRNAASSSEKAKETSQNAASSSEKTKESSQNAASSSEKTKESSQNAAGPSNKVVEAPKPKPSPPTKVTGPSNSASTSAKAKGAQNTTTTGPQPLMSSYSQLVATLSKNKELPMVQPFAPVEVNESPVETPNEMPKLSGPLAVLANTIPHATTILTKMKNTILGTSNEKMNSQPLEYNPIKKKFDVQEEVCNAGPGQIWRVHDAIRKEDALECSVFMFDKRAVDKLYRPKCKELMLDSIKNCISELHKLAHPKMLKILHPLEESTNTVAFASERVYASLDNILAWHESCPIDPEGPFPVIPNPNTLGPPTVEPMPTSSTTRAPFAREYHFLDLEIRHGFHQISEALQYMHLTMGKMHRNVCPSNILVTKRGVWKLFGLEFAEPIPSNDPMKFLSVPQWSCKVPRICQPHLDYMAPETQMRGLASTLADMYALGMILGALFNQGRPLINTNFNPILYVRQMEQLDRNVILLVNRAPDCLHEALPRLLDRDPQNRPTTQLMPLIPYFKCASDPPIQALEALDAAIHKAASERCEYYVDQLPSTLAYIPKKLRWQNVWPVLQAEFKISDMIPSVLKPTFWLINECTPEEFTDVIYPTIRKVVCSPRATPITVVLLENLHILTKKCTEDALNELFPMIFYSLDSNLCQLQIAALSALQNVSDVIPDDIMHGTVVVKVKKLLDKNPGNVKIINLVLGVFEKILPRLDNTSILNYVVPTILNMRLGNPDVINRIVQLYKAIITEEKFGLTCDVMATELIPKLAPQSVNPNLNVDQFNNLIEILYDMLEKIEQYQRHKLKTEGASASIGNRRKIRQMSTENVPAPPFNIPNLRVEQRKTSSAENMVRRSSAATVSQPGSVSESVNALRSRLGQWIFGSNNSTNNDGNFLRVTSILPSRRLSDNTLMTPKIRIAPSCASSPGGTPGGTAGLPSRRHSSIGPQERRLSTANLSPPTHARHPRGRGSGSSLSVPSTSRVGGGSMPNTSSSVPFLSTASCRRPSGPGSRGGSQRGSQGSGILSHMARCE